MYVSLSRIGTAKTLLQEWTGVTSSCTAWLVHSILQFQMSAYVPCPIDVKFFSSDKINSTYHWNCTDKMLPYILYHFNHLTKLALQGLILSFTLKYWSRRGSFWNWLPGKNIRTWYRPKGWTTIHCVLDKWTWIKEPKCCKNILQQHFKWARWTFRHVSWTYGALCWTLRPM